MNTLQAIVDYFLIHGSYEQCEQIVKTYFEMVTKTVLYSWNMKNQTLWRGLSGSDDLGWAAIYCVNAFKLSGNKDFLNYKSKGNGALGAIQLYEIMDSPKYKDPSGKYIFWNSKKSYIASISIELYLNVSLLLLEAT